MYSGRVEEVFTERIQEINNNGLPLVVEPPLAESCLNANQTTY